MNPTPTRCAKTAGYDAKISYYLTEFSLKSFGLEDQVSAPARDWFDSSEISESLLCVRRKGVWGPADVLRIAFKMDSCHTPPDPPAEVIHRPFWRSERAACADLHPDFAEEVLLHIASARGGNIWLRGTFERWKGFTRGGMTLWWIDEKS
ncbi:hypothetical protein CPB85DRAFT_1252692 [Mucidula mucida]|nr:hypothetical protein CPB85DRAFT_1252692 [Mucidula mucida]